MKRQTDLMSTFLVDYEAGESVIHEFMDFETFQKLLKKEEYGEIKILKHVGLIPSMKA